MSPHFGLMDEAAMSREDALLMRAKLHWRCGVRRMRENKAAAGLATLYDALLSAMRWYILVNLGGGDGDGAVEKIENERYVFSVLRRHGLLDDSLDLRLVEDVVDRSLQEEDVGAEQDLVMVQMESFLRRLGMLPFDEAELPPEDPRTF